MRTISLQVTKKIKFSKTNKVVKKKPSLNKNKNLKGLRRHLNVYADTPEGLYIRKQIFTFANNLDETFFDSFNAIHNEADHDDKLISEIMEMINKENDLNIDSECESEESEMEEEVDQSDSEEECEDDQPNMNCESTDESDQEEVAVSLKPNPRKPPNPKGPRKFDSKNDDSVNNINQNINNDNVSYYS